MLLVRVIVAAVTWYVVIAAVAVVTVAMNILAVPAVLAAAVVVLSVVVAHDVGVAFVVGVVVDLAIVDIVAVWGTSTCPSSFCSCVGARACWSFGHGGLRPAAFLDTHTRTKPGKVCKGFKL